MSQLCRWFDLPRRTVYYRPVHRAVVQDQALKAEILAALHQHPTYGYRRLAVVLGRNKKPVQRLLQLNGWQVNKRPAGKCPRAKAMPSVSTTPNQRWATDTARVWCGQGPPLPSEPCPWTVAPAKSSPGASATGATPSPWRPPEALIERFGCLGRVSAPLILRSDNGLVSSAVEN